MNRIVARFEELRKQGRTALIPYLMAGDPHPQTTAGFMHEMVKAGADLIELGVPFSDPIADGPVIQASAERSLAAGTDLQTVLDLVREFRQQDQTTPVILMGYLNPIERKGYQAFADAAATAGVDGVLTVDVPPEECEELLRALRAVQLHPIFLIAPTTTDQRIERICQTAEGFVYYVSLKGVTGAATLDTDAVATNVSRIRAKTDLPVGVGFGISSAESAAQVAWLADAVVVGSALVKQVEAHGEKAAAVVGDLLRQMRAAIDRVDTDRSGKLAVE
ncbi:MAG: tryptophan synthase subunit alpha [Pseudomonadota bacterium]|nr:tryptophan synthase subunit alpha [Pseudomonadota bacterium]